MSKLCYIFQNMFSFTLFQPPSIVKTRRPLRISLIYPKWRRSEEASTNAAFLAATILLSIVALLASQPARADSAPPDLLFIAVDDLSDWISLLDPASPVQTPNLERLASRGMLFTHAYCISPACNPSRAATLVGQRPTTTGVYGNKSDWRNEPDVARGARIRVSVPARLQ